MDLTFKRESNDFAFCRADARQRRGNTTTTKTAENKSFNMSGWSLVCCLCRSSFIQVRSLRATAARRDLTLDSLVSCAPLRKWNGGCWCHGCTCAFEPNWWASKLQILKRQPCNMRFGTNGIKGRVWVREGNRFSLFCSESPVNGFHNEAAVNNSLNMFFHNKGWKVQVSPLLIISASADDQHSAHLRLLYGKFWLWCIFFSVTQAFFLDSEGNMEKGMPEPTSAPALPPTPAPPYPGPPLAVYHAQPGKWSKPSSWFLTSDRHFLLIILFAFIPLLLVEFCVDGHVARMAP